MNSRRLFLVKLVATAATPILWCGRALAQAPLPPAVKLEESDPVATALGFKLDTTQVDPQKYPLHTNEQKCSGCALYQPRAGEEWSPCTAFGGKLAPLGGWCSAFAKKPAAAP